MREKLGKLGTYVAFLGMVVCLAAIVGRFYGNRPVLGFQAVNLFVVGVGMLVWACWAKLEAHEGRITSGS